MDRIPKSEAVSISYDLHQYLKRNPLGYLTMIDNLYLIDGASYTADVGFIASTETLDIGNIIKGYRPALVVLIVTGTGEKSPAEYQELRDFNLSIGAIVWMVYRDEQAVNVYQPNKSVQRKTISDSLTLETLLPGFEMQVRDVFRSLKQRLNEE